MMFADARQTLQGIYTGIGGRPRPAKRTYFIQAEEVMWDYTPRSSEGNLCGPTPQPFNKIQVGRRPVFRSCSSCSSPDRAPRSPVDEPAFR